MMNIPDWVGILLPALSGAAGIGVGWGILRTRVEHIEKKQGDYGVELALKLDEKTHELICKNSALIVANMVEAKLNERHEKDRVDMKEFKREVLEAIKNGGPR
jgi:hypothetical protein